MKVAEKKRRLLNDGYFISLCVFIFLIFMVTNPEITSVYTKKAMEICYFLIIPAIFPFMVMIKLITDGPFISLIGRLTGGFARKLFGISGEYFAAYIIGLIAGFPLGANICAEIYKNGGSKSEAEKTLAFANNCSMAFVLSAAGFFVFGSVKTGALLFLIQIISSFITGMIINKIYSDSPASNERYVNHNSSISSNRHSLAALISEAVNSMLFICGVVIFFYVSVNILMEILNLIPLFSGSEGLKNILNVIFSGIFEISTGVYSLAESNLPFAVKLSAVSAILAFSGMSVHVQIAGTLKNTALSLKPYFTGKTIHVIISTLIAFFISGIQKPTMPVFGMVYFPETYGGAKTYAACLIFSAICAIICAAVFGIIYLAVLLAEKKEEVYKKNGKK